MIVNNTLDQFKLSASKTSLFFRSGKTEITEINLVGSLSHPEIVKIYRFVEILDILNFEIEMAGNDIVCLSSNGFIKSSRSSTLEKLYESSRSCLI